MVQAASTATSTVPPWLRTSMAASWEAPANTMVEKPAAAPTPSPPSGGVAPATNPTGTTPIGCGATAFAPARMAPAHAALDSMPHLGEPCPADGKLSGPAVQETKQRYRRQNRDESVRYRQISRSVLALGGTAHA